MAGFFVVNRMSFRNPLVEKHKVNRIDAAQINIVMRQCWVARAIIKTL